MKLIREIYFFIFCHFFCTKNKIFLIGQVWTGFEIAVTCTVNHSLCYQVQTCLNLNLHLTCCDARHKRSLAGMDYLLGKRSLCLLSASLSLKTINLNRLWTLTNVTLDLSLAGDISALCKHMLKEKFKWTFLLCPSWLTVESYYVHIIIGKRFSTPKFRVLQCWAHVGCENNFLTKR